MNSYEGQVAPCGNRMCRICNQPKKYLGVAKEWVCKPCRNLDKDHPVSVSLKVCKACTTQKSSEHFYKDKKASDGLDRNCKACYKEAYKTNKDVRLFNNKFWKVTNPHKVAYYTSKRRLTQRNATPSWLSVSQKAEIEYKYWLARDLKVITGQNYEVDHIVPVVHPEVSGLHVPWNLQVLPSDLNREKSNKLEIE